MTAPSRSLTALLLWLVLTGCAGSRARKEITGADYVIDDIHFIGVTRFKKRELLEYLHMGETSWLPFTETFYYSEALIPFDIDRITALYRSYGYFDAEVLEIRERLEKRNRIDLYVTVREGAPVRIRRVGFRWPDGRPDSTRAGKVEVLGAVRPGDPLEMPALESSLAAMERHLKEQGFALAEVDFDVLVDREERTAAITFTLIPGRRARIGDVRFEGLSRVPERLAAVETEGIRGKPFSLTRIRRIEEAIYGMNAFSTVEVVVGDHIDDEGFVPLTVVVSELKMQSVKVGVGLAFEPTRWEERVSTLYTHRNLFGELIRLDLRLRLGYAELPTPFNLREHGPTLLLEPRLEKKGWIEDRLVWTATPSFELGVEEGYQFYTPGTRIGVSRFFGEIFNAEISHNFKFFDFFDVSEVLDANRTRLGLDFRDPYILSYIEVGAHFHFTDRRLEPRNGVVFGARYEVAGGVLGGHFDFQRITPEARAYWQLVPRLQLALRAETGYILPYGDRPACPFNMKYYLGGADTVRGWGLRRLSPKTEICPEGTDDRCRRIPVGGDTELLANAELRLRTVDGLYVAVFLDVGDVQPGRVSYRPEEWNLSSGGGLRYASPFGKLRLDVGARLNDTPLSRGEDRWAFHLGLGESF